MSRNFELLTQIETEIGSVTASQKAPADPLPAVEPHANRRNGTEADREIVNLVQRIFLPASGASHRQVVFCGIEKDNGSSSVCAQAASILASSTGEKVCLVDANPRPDGLREMFQTSRPASAPSKPNGHCVEVAQNLWLTHAASSGDASCSAVELRAKLARLQLEYGYVLIDAPGCSVSGEATLFGQLSGAAILVVEAERTRRDNASKAKQGFDAAGVPLLGTVLYNRSFPIPQSLYARL